MNTTCWRLLDRVKLSTGDQIDLTAALDLVQFVRLDVVVTVHDAGEGSEMALELKHAAIAEEGAFVPFEAAMSVPLDKAGVTWFHADAWTRFIGWFVSGELSGSPVVSVDLVARGG